MPAIRAGTPLHGAYATLHKAGFRVAVRGSKLGTGAYGDLLVGSITRKGDAATLVPDEGPTGYPSLAGFVHVPQVHVPNLVGGSAEAAVAWANAHKMWWEIPRLPSLSPSNAPNFYLAYRVVAQSPTGGTIVSGNTLLVFQVESR